MDQSRLVSALCKILPSNLASDLVSHFLQIRSDAATKTLGRASPGKFVESFVQCMQHIARGSYEPSPSVDDYLNRQVEKETMLPEGLRICAARIARSMYTLRNKRNIAHKNEIDPNTFDLAYLHSASCWIVTELVRNAAGFSMEEAGALNANRSSPGSAGEAAKV